MSKAAYSPNVTTPVQLGMWCRENRERRGLALREVAEAVGMHLSHLQKIELGDRLPTPEQAGALARFFGIATEALEARRIAAKFWKDNASNPAVDQAIQMIQETAPAYGVNKSVNKRRKAS